MFILTPRYIAEIIDEYSDRIAKREEFVKHRAAWLDSEEGQPVPGNMSQIWSAVSASPTALAALAASVSALVSLIVALTSPFVAFAIAKKQIRASVVSTNRQAGINGLRDDLAEMLELAVAHFYLRAGSLSGEEDFKYSYEQRTRLWRLQYRIRLRLNADELPHQELLSLLEEVRSLSIKKEPGHWAGI